MHCVRAGGKTVYIDEVDFVRDLAMTKFLIPFKLTPIAPEYQQSVLGVLLLCLRFGRSVRLAWTRFISHRAQTCTPLRKCHGK